MYRPSFVGNFFKRRIKTVNIERVVPAVFKKAVRDDYFTRRFHQMNPVRRDGHESVRFRFEHYVKIVEIQIGVFPPHKGHTGRAVNVDVLEISIFTAFRRKGVIGINLMSQNDRRPRGGGFIGL